MGGQDRAVTSEKQPHLTTDDYRLLVTWMEDEENSDAVAGVSKKTDVTGKKLYTKAKAFGEMAAHLARCTKTKGLTLLIPRNMQQRWDTYVTKFTAAWNIIRQTGWGLTVAEKELGMSIQEKLEQLCPHYLRMANVVGRLASKSPAATVEIGLPATLQQTSAVTVEPVASSTSVGAHSPRQEAHENGEDGTLRTEDDDNEEAADDWPQSAQPECFHLDSSSSDDEDDGEKEAGVRTQRCAVVSLPSSPRAQQPPKSTTNSRGKQKANATSNSKPKQTRVEKPRSASKRAAEARTTHAKKPKTDCRVATAKSHSGVVERFCRAAVDQLSHWIL